MTGCTRWVPARSGPRVVPRSGGSDGVDRFLEQVRQATEPIGDLDAQRRQGVFDPRRDRGDDLAGEQAVPFQDTSILRADSTDIVLAPDHKATEELLQVSGLSYTFLRNGWYIENYTAQLGQYLAEGAITGPAGGGRIAAAARADHAAAAAAALTGPGHDKKIYELGGTRFTLAELAGIVTEESGTPVAYNSVTGPGLVAILTGAGLDAGAAGFVAALDEATARGDLDTDSTDLVALIGRPSTPVAQVVRAALADSAE